MTLTYRLDSDVLWSYGMVLDIETGAVVAPSKSAKWRKPEVVNGESLDQCFSNFSYLWHYFEDMAGK